MKIEDVFEDDVLEESMNVRLRLAYRNFVDSKIKNSLFHMTGSINAVNIIKQDMLDGSYKNQAKDEPKSMMRNNKKFISFSTKRHTSFTSAVIAGTSVPFHVLFELDGRSIISDYETINANFWGEMAKERGHKSFDEFLKQEMDENEVRLFTGRRGVAPLSKYIRNIYILINDEKLKKTDLKKLDMFERKFSNVKFFSSYSDFVTGANGSNTYKDFV